MLNNYHFVGIGGQGMNPLAQYLKIKGHQVSGSDRYYDLNNKDGEVFKKLERLGIKLYSQTGEAISKRLSQVVISSAIESDNADFIRAKELGIPIVKRSESLAQVFNIAQGIAIGGTSGKTTVAGMLATILQDNGFSPTAFLGGELINNYQHQFTGNFMLGNSELVCIEADESDGSIVNYLPKIGLITNISKDHQEVEELIALFQQFACNIKELLVINGDCSNCNNIKYQGKKLTYGLSESCDIRASRIKIGSGIIRFRVDGINFLLNQWGDHNLENALAAIACAKACGVEMSNISMSLKKFSGIKRRMQLIGTVKDISIFDDYAHNPSKIKASINSLKKHFSRLIIMYQCHGYMPTQFMWDDLLEVFRKNLRKQDILIIPPIYDMGGTTNRHISAEALVIALKNIGVKAIYISSREQLLSSVANWIQPGDGIITMGARDESLNKFALEIKNVLSKQETPILR